MSTEDIFGNEEIAFMLANKDNSNFIYKHIAAKLISTLQERVSKLDEKDKNRVIAALVANNIADMQEQEELRKPLKVNAFLSFSKLLKKPPKEDEEEGKGGKSEGNKSSEKKAKKAYSPIY